MTVGLFLNMAALYPVAELHYSQKNKLNSDSIVYQCYGELRFCHINPFGRKAICRYCISRANEVSKKLNLKVIPIQKIKEQIDDNRIIGNIENSVMSSIASLTRISSRDALKSPWDKVYENLLDSSKSIYIFFNSQLQGGVDELLMFNGRFCWDAAARLSAIVEKKNFMVYDFKKTNSYYEFRNISLHSIDENHQKALNFYIKNPRLARKTAFEFIESKISGVPTYEKSYTELQQKNKITVPLESDKKIISIFPSSDDEYKYIGHEWGAEIVNSQPDEIRDFISSIDNGEYQIIIRMHPNMKGLSESVLKSYMQLEKIFKGVAVLEPEDATSTYTLIDASMYVICFCSTVATEANFKGKKVICIGGAPYMRLRVANFVRNGVEAAELVSKGLVRKKVRRASIIWFYYLWKYNDKNDYIRKKISSHLEEPFTFTLAKPYLLRLLQSPFRAEIELRKPSKKNLDYLKRFFKSSVDIFLNKFSIKL